MRRRRSLLKSIGALPVMGFTSVSKGSNAKKELPEDTIEELQEEGWEFQNDNILYNELDEEVASNVFRYKDNIPGLKMKKKKNNKYFIKLNLNKLPELSDRDMSKIDLENPQEYRERIEKSHKNPIEKNPALKEE